MSLHPSVLLTEGHLKLLFFFIFGCLERKNWVLNLIYTYINRVYIARNDRPCMVLNQIMEIGTTCLMEP
jgi:hypothetical protein